jgi:hypothetical protein
MKIAFHINQLSFRGTEVATFEYAYYNRRFLNNISVIIAPVDCPQEKGVLEHFQKEFEVIFYPKDYLDLILKLNRVDRMYVMKSGQQDGIIAKDIPTVVHCVFMSGDPHGLVYASVSDSVANKKEL